MAYFSDIHTHILPGVDDGAKSISDSMSIIDMAYNDGTRLIVCTPHYRGPYKKNTPEHLKSVFEDLKKISSHKYPDLKLYLGNEVYCEPDVSQKVYEGRALTINDTYYCLLEFRTGTPVNYILNGVSEMIRYGFTPIVAHVERYEAFRNNFDLIYDVIEMGAYIQINADSVMGINGHKVKSYCKKILKENLVSFVASDTHNVDKRPPCLSDCYKKVSKKFGTEYADKIFYSNAEKIVENKSL